MTYDPSQTYPSLGLYNAGITTPGGLPPYAALQAVSCLDRRGALNALAATLGISNPAIGVSQAGQVPLPRYFSSGRQPTAIATTAATATASTPSTRSRVDFSRAGGNSAVDRSCVVRSRSSNPLAASS